jgi:predicted DNA-binding antitoxin AbrB/MazE fold protein
MPIEIDAIYDHGLLKLDHAVPLRDQQRVRVTIHDQPTTAERTYGLIGWTGDPAIVRQIALSEESGVAESP